MNITEKLIKSHLVSGEMIPGKEIAIKIDQTLTQDSTGTMAYLQFEAIGIPRVKTEKSVADTGVGLLRNCDCISNRFSISVFPLTIFLRFFYILPLQDILATDGRPAERHQNTYRQAQDQKHHPRGVSAFLHLFRVPEI